MQHCIQSFISKENAGKASVGVAAMPGASACKLWQLGERDRERKLHDTSSTALARNQSGESFSRAFERTRRGFYGPLKTHDLKA
jgi:hypothetical protein